MTESVSRLRRGNADDVRLETAPGRAAQGARTAACAEGSSRRPRLPSSPTDTSTSGDPRAGRARGGPETTSTSTLRTSVVGKRTSTRSPSRGTGSHPVERLIVDHEAATALEIAAEARGSHRTDGAAEQGIDGAVRGAIVDPGPHAQLIAVVAERVISRRSSVSSSSKPTPDDAPQLVPRRPCGERGAESLVGARLASRGRPGCARTPAGPVARRGSRPRPRRSRPGPAPPATRAMRSSIARHLGGVDPRSSALVARALEAQSLPRPRTVLGVHDHVHRLESRGSVGAGQHRDRR